YISERRPRPPLFPYPPLFRSKGIHNTRHTFGRRLRSAGVPLETRKTLLGHANGDITTHYSAAEIEELRLAVQRIVNPRVVQAPRSEEHTSELQSRENLVCRLL